MLIISSKFRILFKSRAASFWPTARHVPIGSKIYRYEWQYFNGENQLLNESEVPAFIAYQTGRLVENFTLGIMPSNQSKPSWFVTDALPIQDKNSVRLILLRLRPLQSQSFDSFSEVVSALPSMVYSVDLTSGQYQSFNGQIESVLGYSTQEIETSETDFFESIASDRSEQQFFKEARTLLTQRQGSIENPSSFERVLRVRSKQDTLRWLLMREVITSNKTHFEPQKIIGTAIDLTHVFESSNLMTDVSLLLSGVFHHIRVMIILRDSDGLILSANREFYNRTGYRTNHIFGKRLNDLLIESDQSISNQMWQRLIEDSSYHPFEAHLKTRSGEIRSIMVSSAMTRNLGGENQYIVTAIEDLTEIRMLEKQLSEARQMEMIGSLAGGVAHDFNNILQSISNFNTLISKEAQRFDVVSEPALMNRINFYLDHQKKLVERGSELTAQINEVGRLKEKNPIKIDIKKETVDLIEIVKAEIDPSIDLSLELCHSPVIAFMNQVSYRRIIENLISNAVRAIKINNGRVLKISVATVSLKITPLDAMLDIEPGDYAILSVLDSGTGIAKENIRRIFDPFFSECADLKGTGLGLAVVYAAVRRMKGTIVVDSQVGEYTNFKIYFPLMNEDLNT
ncbi:MAG: PAS domain S-box protein [Leptonema sp. (in: Bacteria)]|nr:PAS domain S-box protein [Leptonema sp. (in: bacteria)]